MECCRQAMLGNATLVSAQTGRKLNNALSLTFKTSADHTLATAVQAKSLGALFGFKNGGGGRYNITGEGGEVTVNCAGARTQLGDLLLAACVDMTVGSHRFMTV